MPQSHLLAVLILSCCLVPGCGRESLDTASSSAAAARDEALPMVTTQAELTAAIDHRVRISGVAVRTKGWPSLMSEEYMVRLKDLPEWKPEEEGQVLTFTGRVSMRTTPPRSDDGAMRQDFEPGTDVYSLEDCVRVRE